MKPTEGERVTVMIENEARRATVRSITVKANLSSVGGGRDVNVFLCDLEPDPLRGYNDDSAVVFVEHEGILWARGWDPETTTALRAAAALSDLGANEDNLMLGTSARRRAARRAQ